MIIDAPRPDHIGGLRHLWEEAFGDTDEFLDAFFQTAYAPQRCRCVTVEDEVAAVLYWFDCSCRGQKLAYFYAIATAKAHRGKGLCTSLMDNTHRYLTSRGYCGAVLVPGSASLFDFYRKMNYRAFGSIEKFSCDAATDGVAIRRIDSAEYAERRRALLPAGGIVQEKENLDFLQMQATLYAGDGFVLAARQEGKELFGVELLGERALAPAITKGLGCARATFRTPGGQMPFAMYLCLGENGEIPPDYFGLAFD